MTEFTPKEKQLIEHLINKDIRNLHNIVKDKDMREIVKDDYRKLLNKLK